MAEELEVKNSQEEDEPESSDESKSEKTDGDPDDPIADDPELQSVVYQLILKLVGEDRFGRMVEIQDCGQARFYWRGLQYIWWSNKNRQFMASSSGGLQAYGDADMDDQPHFEFVTNIYQANGLSATATLTGASIPIRWFPEDADVSDDIETAEGYGKLAKKIQRWNPSRLLMQEEAYYLWTDGVFGLYTEPIPDGEKTESKSTIKEGTATEPDEVQCPQCGFKAPTEPVSYTHLTLPTICSV